MIDIDKYEGHTPAPWTNEYDEELGEHTIESGDGMVAQRVLGVDAQLIADAPLLLEEVKRLREQYTELREALVGDSPNWTHEELIERALEMSEPAELEFGEWHTDMGEEE